MTDWPTIPDDVVSWFRAVWAEANRRVCERLINVPNIRETSLDDGLIESLIPDSAPRLLPSGAIVRMDMHNIGGLRRLRGWGPPWAPGEIRRWETADIAVLVFVYRGDALIAKKIGLLQSKRLYPLNNDIETDDEIDILYGMNRFLGRDDHQAAGALHKKFEFTDACLYGSIEAGSHQIQSIDRLNTEFGKAIYYLLYNPYDLPCCITYPVLEKAKLETAGLGCRVVDSENVHRVLASLSKGASPAQKAVFEAAQDRQWPLETWAADLLLTCKVGEQFDESREERVRYFLERRSGPIGAALAASITLPESDTAS